MSGTRTAPAEAGDSTTPAPAEPRGRVGLARWAADLATGGRFAVTGGREGWTRTLLTALGVGLGVALLLIAASAPNVISSQSERGDARIPFSVEGNEKPGRDTLLTRAVYTDYHGQTIQGTRVIPEGERPPLPPGVKELPGPGEMVVSPALRELLDSGDGKLLRERLADRIIGTIGDSGLRGPKELWFYAGAPRAEAKAEADVFSRIERWGMDVPSAKLSPSQILLIIVGCVVLLLPVAVFIATAARFGGERRDRRLAALRLVGADSHMTRRIAAGEALCGALLGLAVGGALFLGVRELVGEVSLWDTSVFPSDIQPSAPLAALILLAVPASAVIVTLFALRGIVIEPLGVVRNTRPRRRRLWWRLALPALGLALLLPLLNQFDGAGERESYQVAAGAVLVLIGTTALLPWVVEAAVERFHGGPLPWQLATRRLQLSSGTAARAVSGITVAVAGAIALQMLFSSVEAENTKDTGVDTTRVQFQSGVPVRDGEQARQVATTFRETPGVTESLTMVSALAAAPKASAGDERPVEQVTLADCATLRKTTRVRSCRDGDVFVTEPPDYVEPDTYRQVVAPGRQVRLVSGYSSPGEGRLWTIPRTARVVPVGSDPTGMEREGILVTPGALKVSELNKPTAITMLALREGDRDAVERARNTEARFSPGLGGYLLSGTEETRRFATIRRGLLIGATATLLLIGASMIVSTLEQLRERRRLLSVLVAFGTRRSTLSWSVLWQTAVPVVLGLAVSVAGGLTLGAILLRLIGEPVAVDWWNLATMTGVGASVIVLVTLASLPPLWRMMRPDGLRSE